MILKDRFLYFDFEITWKNRHRVREFASREILAYLKSLGKTVGPVNFPIFMQSMVEYYPGRDLLENAYRIMYHHPNPILRWARQYERRFLQSAAKPFSKPRVAKLLKKLLDQKA